MKAKIIKLQAIIYSNELDLRLDSDNFAKNGFNSMSNFFAFYNTTKNPSRQLKFIKDM